MCVLLVMQVHVCVCVFNLFTERSFRLFSLNPPAPLARPYSPHQLHDDSSAVRLNHHPKKWLHAPEVQIFARRGLASRKPNKSLGTVDSNACR